MTTPSEQSFAQKINTWLQTIGIVVAAAWGAYTFIYKDIMLPKAAPVNVTVDLQLKKIGQPNLQMKHGKNSEDKVLIAIEMDVSATNPSSREVALLPSLWTAYGRKVEANPQNPDFSKDISSVINAKQGIQVEKETTYLSSSIVAVGRLFADTSLKPNERIARKIVFHILPNRYDLIDVVATIPTMEKKEGATLEWKYDEKNELRIFLYYVTKNGERKEIAKNKDGDYVDTKFEFQSATSVSTLSLWQ